jgi:hypothetical protein
VFFTLAISPLLEDEKDSAHHQAKTSQIVPFQLFLQIDHGEDAKYNQGNHFLDGFQLGSVELIMSDAIHRHLEAIFDEGDSLTDKNHDPQGRILELEVPIPSDRHEDIGDGQ